MSAPKPPIQTRDSMADHPVTSGLAIRTLDVSTHGRVPKPASTRDTIQPLRPELDLESERAVNPFRGHSAARVDRSHQVQVSQSSALVASKAGGWSLFTPFPIA